MKKFVLDYINRLEGFKTGIKSLHWNSRNLEQHKLCDEIAQSISDFQDQVSEIEQSITGKLPFNQLKGKPYKVKSLMVFIDDVIIATKKFYGKLKHKNDDYAGMRSDCEAFLSTIQKQKYLIDFTLKENLKKRVQSQINEQKVNNDDTLYVLSHNLYEYHLNAQELAQLIAESVRNVIQKQ